MDRHNKRRKLVFNAQVHEIYNEIKKELSRTDIESDQVDHNLIGHFSRYKKLLAGLDKKWFTLTDEETKVLNSINIQIDELMMNRIFDRADLFTSIGSC